MMNEQLLSIIWYCLDFYQLLNNCETGVNIVVFIMKMCFYLQVCIFCHYLTVLELTKVSVKCQSSISASQRMISSD